MNFTKGVSAMQTAIEDRRGGVRVIQQEVDWNSVAWSTLQQLMDVGPSPGADEEIVAWFRFSMHEVAAQLGTQYVNPQFTVTADGLSLAFIRRARQAQRAWLKTLKTVLGKSGCLKRELRKVQPEIRQLAFTGVMIVAGKHIHPQRWPVGEPAATSTELIGQRFGRLIVVKQVGGGRWLCTCDCGGQNAVRRKHLLRGKIRSCGCLKAELEAGQKQRKADRALKYSGALS
jgi:hypothetical protein